jgi:hypothetical protein
VIPILVEPISDSHYRAATGGPLRLETEAPTREQAIQKLRELIESRISSGAEVVDIAIGAEAHPLAPFAGLLRDDPLVEPWKQAMAEYREERDGVAESS